MWKCFVVALALAAAPVAAQPADGNGAAAQPPDEGNVASRLIRDVASDYKNFLSVDTAQRITIGAFAAGAVHAADGEIASSIQESDTVTFPGAANYGSQLLHLPVAAAWWMIASAAGSSRHAAAGRDLLRAQISVVSWSYAIKYATDRTRPNGDPRSLPSGHASTSFATATVLQTHYGWKLGLPAYLLATYTGVSRIYENQHWASDVVLGAAVGIASGRTATVRLRRTSLTVAPLAVPGGGGVMFTNLR
jgi:membrane-associated phospholipid phosphatase